MMQRYFMELAYNGAPFFGWQKQPQQLSVQEVIEDALTTILGKTLEVTGCGRTDTGVHAAQYYAHFNYDGTFPQGFLRRINKFLPDGIVIRRIFPVHWDAHARFDAYSRSYSYHLTFRKDPFHIQTAYQFPYARRPNPERMQQAAALLLDYQEFFPFCKSHHNAKTMVCELRRSEWILDEANDRMTYHITANRFLRGMVRLIVGMCINVGQGKVPLEAVKEALETQQRLQHSTSAPPQGLFLRDIRYPFIDEQGNYAPPG